MGEARDGDPTAAGGRPEDRPGHGDRPDRPVQRPSWDPVVSPDGRRSSDFESALSGEQESVLVDASAVDGDGHALPTELLRRFDPTGVGLDDITAEQAEAYIAANAELHPWLAPACDELPEVKRVIAVMDGGQGHALQRHEGAVTDEMTMLRVTQLRDPAISDPRERVPGKDAYRGGLHRCGRDATRITDPAVFVTAFVRAVGHPKTHKVLEAPFNPKKEPAAVDIDLAELLGPGAAKYCAGHRPDAIDGNGRKAARRRKAWVKASRAGDAPDAPELTATRLVRADFEGAHLLLAFRPNRDKTGWEPATMYVEALRNRPRVARP